MRAKAGWMDVDHAEEMMMTIGTGDTTVAIGTMTAMMMGDSADIIAPADLTAMVTGDIAIETGTATGPGVGAVASRYIS